MYTHYFGFSIAPFSIAPDPRFLYLSASHREALAHLLYGVEQGGFVVLTGEVGTGKTTVCRCLLQQLPSHVDVAYVINPRQSVTELLQSILAELGLDLGDEITSNKLLVDLLNERLLEGHAQGRNTILIIDEAQNLAPDVLEQLRLLTNLETSERKLLQLILLGQPELNTLLGSPALRQLAQRVTARYHLAALSRVDVGEYIAHRLAIAGFQGALFTAAAVRHVARRSRGIPRLINLICDRALLGVYASSGRRVDYHTSRRAAAEVMPSTTTTVWSWRTRVLLGLGLTSIAGLGYLLHGLHELTPSPVPMQASEAVGTYHASRKSALQELGWHWGLLDDPIPCPGIVASGLWCAEMSGEGAWLEQAGLPVVLELEEPREYVLHDPAKAALPKGLRKRWQGQAWLLTPLDPALAAALPMGEGAMLPPALQTLLQSLPHHMGEPVYAGYEASVLYETAPPPGLVGVLFEQFPVLQRDGPEGSLTPALSGLLRDFQRRRGLSPHGQLDWPTALQLAMAGSKHPLLSDRR